MTTPERYLRFSLSRRLEHWITATSFIILALTGLPQKYASAPFWLWVITVLGGIEAIRIIHRVAAGVLALVALYHIGFALYHWYVQRGRLSMMLSKEDALNAWQTLRHNFGRAPEPPKQGFYTFEEKVEYWALLWGTLVMVATGFFLWNPITAARLLPGQFIPAAKAAHGGEALLAVLSILLWHLYHVLVRHFNKSMFTGYLSREEMEHQHPLALEEPLLPLLDPAKLQKRRQKFWVGYSIGATLWLVGVVWFVTSEQTASASPANIPDIQAVKAFSPIAPTPLPTAVLYPTKFNAGTSWQDRLGTLISARCGECHNPVVQQRNLDLTTYAGLFEGGDSGPAVVRGAPGVSLIVLWPYRELHPGKWSPSERLAIQTWILNGAPER